VWPLVSAARFVAAGALPYLYEAGRYTGLPVAPVAVAPFVLAGDSLGFVDGAPIPVPTPTMWLVVGPLGLLVCGMLPVAASSVVSGRGRSLGAIGHVMLFVTGVAPLAWWGHYEDAAAISLLLLAVRAADGGRETRSALLLAAAIGSKQWAIFAVPVVIVGLGVTRKGKFLAIAGGVPAALALVCLAASPTRTAEVLLRPPAFPRLGHAAPWSLSDVDRVAATPFRGLLLLVLAAVLLALRRRGGTQRTVTALGLVLAARVLVEPVLFAYYLSPGLVMLVVGRTLEGRNHPVELVAAATAVSMFFVPAAPAWWALFLPLTALAVLPAAVRLVREQHPPPGSHSRLRGNRQEALFDSR
jgi:hypothetical protein